MSQTIKFNHEGTEYEVDVSELRPVAKDCPSFEDVAFSTWDSCFTLGVRPHGIFVNKCFRPDDMPAEYGTIIRLNRAELRFLRDQFNKALGGS